MSPILPFQSHTTFSCALYIPAIPFIRKHFIITANIPDLLHCKLLKGTNQAQFIFNPNYSIEYTAGSQ